MGFDVVPTDCAAARVASRIPSPTHLDIAFMAGGGASRGTRKTMIESLRNSSRVRRDGRIVDVAFGEVQRLIPFSDRERNGVAIPWGDVSTAYHSTGIPNVRVFQPISPKRLRGLTRWLPLASTAVARRLLSWWTERSDDGPGEQQRRQSRSRVWCEVRNEAGETACAEMICPNGYALTADAAVTAVESLLASETGTPPLGFATPSMAFGAGFVDRLDGVEWVRS